MRQEVIKFYYILEFEAALPQFPQLNLSNAFPGFSQAVCGSKEFDEYEKCIHDCVDFMKAKLAVLNKDSETYKIYWVKNQFNELDPNWESTELVKIYIANSSQDVYNGSFRARVFFSKEEVQRAFYFDAPTTLQ
jgi:hypothetical protein